MTLYIKSLRFPRTNEEAEAMLFNRLITLVLSWPCSRCGKPGICGCYAEGTGACAQLGNKDIVLPTTND